MRVFWRAALAVVAVIFAQPTIAAPLWQNVGSGMTAAEIRKAQPAAIDNPKPETLKNGAKCELVIQSLAIGTDNYEVCFFILGGKLHQVTLGAQNPNRPMFESTVDLLRSKYGPELGAGQPLCRSGMLTICEAKWMLKTGVNISALFMQVSNNDPLVNIVYQTRMAADASKL